MKLKQLLASALLVCSSGAWAQTDVTSTYLTNADFETSPTFDGTSLGSNTDPKSNATPTDGSELLSGAKNVYQISGWTLMTTETSDFARTFTMPYETSLWVNGNNNVAGQQVTTPSNGSSVTEGNSNVLFVEANWCNQALLGVKQVVNLPAGKYTLTFDTYVTTNLKYGTSRCGVSYADKSTYKWPASLNTWTNNEITFTLSDATDVTISMGYLKNANQGGGNSPFLFVDNVKLTYTAIVVKDVLQTALTAATTANASLSDATLATAITTAQGVYDDNDATQDEVNAAAATLNVAIELAMSAAGDASFLIPNLGFESCTVTTTNAAAGGSAAPLDIAGNWTQTSSAAWSSSAVVEYGGDGQVNGVKAPSTDNAGNSGKTLGVSVGWGGTVTYKSASATWPAGVYTIKAYAYNALSGKTQFTSQFGFVPTSGSASLSTKTSFAYGTWETDQVTFTLNEATEGYIQIGGQAVSGGSGDNAKVFFDNITIGYQSFLAGAKTAWDEAKAAAEAAVANEAYENVTGEELTALNAEIAKAEPTTVDDYNSAAAALQTATATFTAAKDAYDGLANLWNAGVPELIYATTEKYTAIGDAYFGEGDVVDAADASARTAAMITAIRAYYESHAMAEKVEGAVDCADAIAGADPDTNTGWTGGIGTDSRDWEKYTDAAGNLSGKYYDGGWSTSAGVNITMSRSIEIPAGKYLLTVTARGSEALTSYTLSVGENAVDLPKNGSGVDQGVFGHGWDDVSLEFESDGHPVTLTIAATSTEYQQWISFNRFRLVRLELNNDVYAGATEYAALNGAIEAAEAKTLGFENSQYAPYNNVAALEALAAAKAINQTAELTNFKTDVAAATEALNDATWTANDGDVDAIYNGHFAEANGNNPKGWTRSNDAWGQQITGLEVSTGAETSTAWYYNTNGAWEYGKDGVYTMPLAANQTYELSFKYRKNGNDWQNWMKASVVNGENEGLEVAQFSPADNGTNFVEAKAYFTTGAAGNYILSIEQNGNAHLTDVSLVKVASATLVLSENEDYAPIDRTYYETVSLTRTVKEGYNTVVLPFDLTAEQVAAVFGEGAKVYSFTETSESADNVAVQFNETATISANVPVLVNATAESTVKNINNVVFKSGEAKVEGANVDFVGVYSSAKVEAGDYFIANSKLYKCTKDDFITIKPFRAYIDAPEEASVKFFFGGVEYTDIATALSAIEAAGARSTVFNLAGQRVGKAQKGVYVVGGKKVIIK